MIGVKRSNSIRNEIIKGLFWVHKGADEIIKENMRGWYGHMNKSVKRLFENELTSVRKLGTPHRD